MTASSCWNLINDPFKWPTSTRAMTILPLSLNIAIKVGTLRHLFLLCFRPPYGLHENEVIKAPKSLFQKTPIWEWIPSTLNFLFSREIFSIWLLPGPKKATLLVWINNGQVKYTLVRLEYHTTMPYVDAYRRYVASPYLGHGVVAQYIPAQSIDFYAIESHLWSCLKGCVLSYWGMPICSKNDLLTSERLSLQSLPFNFFFPNLSHQNIQ